mgnify:CR=1 FL=1
MRACMWLVTGLLIGASLQAVVAQDKGPNTNLIAMNHVAISVPNFQETLDYYTKTLGFPQAFRVNNEDRKSTRLNSSHVSESRMPSSA